MPIAWKSRAHTAAILHDYTAVGRQSSATSKKVGTANDVDVMIERYRRPIERDPPPPETQSKLASKRLIWRQLKLNKNLCNYPIARSARTKGRWRPDDHGPWCRLPGEDRIELALPPGTPREKHRIPTGFDMNVLYRLLAAEQEAAPERAVRHLVFFRSRAAFLRELHLTNTEKNYRRLLESFGLWSRLSIHFVSCPERGLKAPWHVPSSKDHPEGRRIAKSLPPPIRRFERRDREIVVQLHEDWIDLAKPERYFAQIPFPLPHEATVQNMALWHLAWVGWGKEQATAPFKWRTVCRKIGLRPEKEKFKQIFKRMSEWFELRGGGSYYLHDGDEPATESAIKPGEFFSLWKSPTIPRRKSDKATGRRHKPASLKGQKTSLKGQKRPKQRPWRGNAGVP
jgi:hypothetical protein